MDIVIYEFVYVLEIIDDEDYVMGWILLGY